MTHKFKAYPVHDDPAQAHYHERAVRRLVGFRLSVAAIDEYVALVERLDETADRSFLVNALGGPQEPFR